MFYEGNLKFDETLEDIYCKREMSQKKETFYLSNVRFIIPFQMQ